MTNQRLFPSNPQNESSPNLRTRTRREPRWTTVVSISFAAAVTVMLPPSSVAFVPPSVHPQRYSLPFHTTSNDRDDTAFQKRAFSTEPLFVAKSGGKMIETVEDFSSTVMDPEAQRPVLVFFTAPWCGPCRLSIPVVKEIIKEFSGKIDVVEVCTDDLAETSADCGVVSIPTIQFYYRGELMDTIVGCVARSVLSSAVTKVLEDIAAATGVES